MKRNFSSFSIVLEGTYESTEIKRRRNIYNIYIYKKEEIFQGFYINETTTTVI